MDYKSDKVSLYDIDINKLIKLYYEKHPNVINDIHERFYDNMKRIFRILNFSLKLNSIIKKFDPKQLDEFTRFYSDILRSIVVFLHSSMEEYLRECLRIKLIDCSKDILEKIPLVGNNEMKKFNLSDLYIHKEKTVKDLFNESIKEKLNRTSFNSIEDIASWLEMIKIEQSDLKLFFPILDKMIKRRHQIVHKADCLEVSTHNNPAPIDSDTVMDWCSVTFAFIQVLSKKIFSDDKKLDMHALIKNHNLSHIIKIEKENI